MHQATEHPKGYFRAAPSSAFDQYLADIQKLPLITDVAEERRLARLAQKGDEAAAERLVTANLRFVISYVKKYQGHGLDLSELVAIGNEGLKRAPVLWFSQPSELALGGLRLVSEFRFVLRGHDSAPARNNRQQDTQR